ncbi:hypothetical protein ACOZ4F_07085 [Haloarcula marismortui]|uniref:hypothetical protein n=1 Tax=Haloarcula marismortui TaxID=2238 RepID=UPI003C738C2E
MGEDNGGPPSERNPRAFEIVKRAVNDHLDKEYAWPRTILEFELRGAGVYPDFVGQSLLELHEAGIIGEQTEIEGRKYLTRNQGGGEISQIMRNCVDGYYDLLDEVGKFGELVAYAALCDVSSDYDNLIYHVLPESDQTHRLQGISYEPDVFIEFGDKCTPVEVYNGTEYITKDKKKVQKQTLRAASRENPHSRPLLVAPLVSEEAEEVVLNGDGVATQFGKPLVCRNKLSQYERYLEYLNVKSNFRYIPPIKTKDGTEIDGEEYDRILGSAEYRGITEEKIKSDRIPDEYIERIRGGIQLVYVSSIYPEASNKIEEYACLVLQPLFHHLLRNDGVSEPELLDFGWDDFTERYPKAKGGVSKEAVFEMTQNYIEHLLDIGMIVEEGGSMSTYESKHPHLSLSLDEGLPI